MQSRVFDGRKLIDLTDRIDRETAILCGCGRFGDVYKCNYRELSGSSSTVAVKAVRYFTSSADESDAINMDLRRELGLWRRLDCDHRNIVPLLGVAKGFGPLDAIVLAWMPNGTLHSFIKGAGKAYSLVERLSMLHGIGSCLEYLHSIPVLHGDLTSSNILIDEEYNPRLTDFGLSCALGKLQTGMTYLNRCSISPGAMRWAAPELFDDACEPKPSADMYSFGCIMLEMLSGSIPWEGKNDMVVIGLKILQRKFPDRPTSLELQDEQWELIVMCWSLPEKRPTAQQILRYLTDLQSVDSEGHHRVQEAVRYVTDYPSVGNKRALLIAIRHVHRKANLGLSNLHWTHRDAQELYCNLINSQGYHAEDIVLMMDDKHHPKELWPTKRNILRQIDRLVSNASDNSRVFFCYTGHGAESVEGANRQSEIIAADGKVIPNYILHERVVTPLAKVKGSKLFALFDCSHSENLLDLQLGEGPNTYSRRWSVSPGQVFKAVAISIVQLLRLSRKCSRKVGLSSSPQPKYAILPNKPESGSLDVTGVETDTRRSSVISLSACRHGQQAHDDEERQLTFIKFFLDALAARPGLSWVELRDDLKARISEMRARYVAYLQGVQVEDDMSFEPWTQEPRYSTSSHTDLTRKVSL